MTSKNNERQFLCFYTTNLAVHSDAKMSKTGNYRAFSASDNEAALDCTLIKRNLLWFPKAAMLKC